MVAGVHGKKLLKSEPPLVSVVIGGATKILGRLLGEA